MTTFRVGQRVRIVRGTAKYQTGRGKTHFVPGMVGTEATVVGTVSHPNAGFDAHGVFDTSIQIINGMVGMFPSVCLEPATGSYDKVEWSACLWMPEHMRDVA